MKKNGKYERRRPEVKQQTLDKMGLSENITKLAIVLGIPRSTLYLWRRQELAKAESKRKKPKNREEELAREVLRLKEALAERCMDLDFFKGALQRIWERQQPNSAVVESASTTRSGK